MAVVQVVDWYSGGERPKFRMTAIIQLPEDQTTRECLAFMSELRPFR